MEIWILVGCFGFVFWCWNLLSQTWGELWLPHRTRILNREIAQNDIKGILLSRLFLAFSVLNWGETINLARDHWMAAPEKKRLHLLDLGLSFFSFWVVPVVMIFYLRFNGLYVLGFGIGLQIFSKFTKKRFVFKTSQLLVALGLFLVSMGLVLKNVLIFQNLGIEYGFGYWLANGQPGNLFGIIFFSFLMTLLLPFSGWSWTATLSLLGSLQISLNGSIALFVGEILGILFLFLFPLRLKDSKVKKDLFIFTMVVVGAAFLGLLGFGWIRNGFHTYSVEGLEGFDEKLFQLGVGYLCILAPIFLFSMIWGHFRSQK